MTRTVSAVAATTDAPAPAPASSGPLQVVRRYWKDVGAGRYSSAYGRLVPGSNPQTSSEFVSAERQADIQSVTFRGRLASVSASTAVVAVDALATVDATYGCRAWSGEYQLAREAGKWLISRAQISPGRCASAEQPSTSDGADDAGCSPVANSGNCYEPGEFCRDSDHGVSGTDGEGEAIVCADNDGWRWEPS